MLKVLPLYLWLGRPVQDKLFVLWDVFPADEKCLIDTRMGGECNVDFTWFNAETAQLHLVIETTMEREQSVLLHLLVFLLIRRGIEPRMALH